MADYASADMCTEWGLVVNEHFYDRHKSSLKAPNQRLFTSMSESTRQEVSILGESVVLEGLDIIGEFNNILGEFIVLEELHRRRI